jgi:hypothetical protein
LLPDGDVIGPSWSHSSEGRLASADSTNEGVAAIHPQPLPLRSLHAREILFAELVLENRELRATRHAFRELGKLFDHELEYALE